jgi:hypothetical protein
VGAFRPLPLAEEGACRREGSWAETWEAWAYCGLDRQGHQQDQAVEALGLSAGEVASVLHQTSNSVASDPCQGASASAGSGLAGSDATHARGCETTRPWGIRGAAVDAAPYHYSDSLDLGTPVLGR